MAKIVGGFELPTLKKNPKALPLGYWQINYKELLNTFEYFRYFGNRMFFLT